MPGEQPKQRVFVIGQQFADAQKVEASRIAQGNSLPSPIGPELRYNFMAGECDLVNPRRLPCDEKLAEICGRFAGSDAAARADLRHSASMEDLYALLTFARRSAVFAMRGNAPRLVQDGIAAIAFVEVDRVDFRDAVVAIALLYSAAKRIGADPDELVRASAALADARMSDLMLGFIKRPAGSKSFRSMGFMESEIEGRVGLIPSEFAPYNPTFPLDHIALELARLVGSDQYKADFTLSSALPKTWLSGIDDALLEKVLKSVRGGAAVNGRLRPEAFPEYQYQQLTLFLIELPDESAARTLDTLACAKSNRPNDFSLLAVSHGRLFCLTIARSYTAGAKSFETSSSLPRFGPGIAGILKAFNRLDGRDTSNSGTQTPP
jgi:hypothetical protein